ncbi:MAG TPA: DUF5050 domain-containing protein, partial [Aggregatilineales bacterium]|nr:DUF5050 domain-containing protein [Aggregatilineales bacterium]
MMPRHMIYPVLWISAVLILISTGLLSYTRRTPYTDSPYILFLSDRDGIGHLWRMNADGSHPRRLSDHFFPQLAQWSPDGRWILYQHGIGTLGIDVYRMDAHGRRSEQIMYSTGGVILTAWSPDSQSIAYVDPPRSDGVQLHLMRSDGSESRALSPAFEAISTPLWSSDGDWLYFTAQRNQQSDLYRVRVDGTDLQNLTATPLMNERFPRWLPGNEWIAFFVYDGNERRSIRMRRDGSETVPLSDNLSVITTMFWSPDARWLLMVQLVGNSFDILKMPPPPGCQPDFECPHAID